MKLNALIDTAVEITLRLPILQEIGYADMGNYGTGNCQQLRDAMTGLGRLMFRSMGFTGPEVQKYPKKHSCSEESNDAIYHDYAPFETK